jgi:hypothetical protein
MTARERTPIKHGTNRGYARHVARGHVKLWASGEMDRCQACVEAHRVYDAERRARKRRHQPERELRPPAHWRRTIASRIPNDVLGELLLHVPDDVELWAREHLGNDTVDRALWWVGRTDRRPGPAVDAPEVTVHDRRPTADRSAA